LRGYGHRAEGKERRLNAEFGMGNAKFRMKKREAGKLKAERNKGVKRG